jgi:protein-arginine kinase activator protein McsA
MKRRIDLFLKLRSYYAVAKAEGVDPATIRKQMKRINHPEVKELVEQRTRKKYDFCYKCNRSFKEIGYCCKGLCRTCYTYFWRKPMVRRGQRI